MRPPPPRPVDTAVTALGGSSIVPVEVIMSQGRNVYLRSRLFRISTNACNVSRSLRGPKAAVRSRHIVMPHAEKQ